MDESVRNIDIHTLIPQREPLLMVTRLEYFDMQKVVSSLLIGPDNFFVSDGHFETIGLVENIAQTCALRQGYIARYIEGSNVKAGVIGGVDNLVISGQPNVGDTVRTEVTVTAELGEYLMVHAVVTEDVLTVMEADVKLKICNS